jgi:acetyltransferase-like isoleucine patch superfamily enzyme
MGTSLPTPGIVQARGRLGSSRAGMRIDAIWRKINERIAVSGDVRIGRGLRLGLGATIWSAHGLVIGDFCAIGRGSQISADGRLGHFVLAGPQVHVLGRADHAIDQLGVPVLLAEWVGDRPAIPRDAVHIGTDVWLGARSTVLGGVTIGDCAVIGAAAVVTQDVPAYAVAVGNPARVVGQRFTPAEGVLHLQRLSELHESLRASPNES